MTDQAPVRNALILRAASTPEGTFGTWKSDSGFQCVSLEKPWLDNETDKSCVPLGKYFCLWQPSSKHQCNLYHLQNVPDRTAVEIHSANMASQLQGCIAPGMAIATFKADVISLGVPYVDTKGVSASKDALYALEKDMRDEKGEQVSFWLEIKEE